MHLTMLDGGIPKAVVTTVCLSVGLSVDHTHEPCLNGSRYQNTFTLYDRAMSLVS